MLILIYNYIIMKEFTPKKFNIPKLKGISSKTTEEHLKLYEGYVKNSNLILSKIRELSKDSVTNAYELGELQRRFGFEYDGMKNHEFYFSSFEGGPKEIPDGDLKIAIADEWGSFEDWLFRFKAVARIRGVGWAMLYFDKKNNCMLNAWVNEQHSGQLTGLSPVLALDMWEHSFVADYQPSGKGDYIDDFFSNLNWEMIENNFKDVS